MHLSSNKKRLLIFAFVASLIAAITSVLVLYFSMKAPKKTTVLQDKLKNYVSETPEKNAFSILVMGYGGAGHAGGGLSDANVVIYVDNDKKQVSLISIPRDLWVPIPLRSDLKQKMKINTTFAIGNDDRGYPTKQSEFKGKDGGGNMAKYVFGQTLGINIDYYAAIDFERFKKAIDALNGITVDVPVSFTDKYFPIKGNEDLLCDFPPEKVAELNATLSGFELEKQFECRYETLDFTKGPTQMDGETALKFIRSRHSDQDGGDFARGRRTVAVLEGIKNKLLSLDALNNIDEFYGQFSKMVSTDINENVVLDILSKISKPNEYKIQKLNIQDLVKDSVSADRQSILIPNSGENNFSEIQSYIKKNLN